MANSTDEMRVDWDKRARDDALYWVYTVHGRQVEDIHDYYADGARQAIEMIAPQLERWNMRPEGMTCLEIGCGIGRLFQGFAELGFSRIIGVDVSPEMVRRGAEWLPTPGAEFHLGDGASFKSIEPESIDFCFSYNVFQHLPERRLLWRNLEEIARVLKPGGRFQFHFRGRYNSKQFVVRMVPGPLVPAARFLYRTALLKSPEKRSKSTVNDPGRKETWESGIAVRPAKVHSKLSELGFSDIGITTDPDYYDGNRYWASGLKQAIPRVNAP